MEEIRGRNYASKEVLLKKIEQAQELKEKGKINAEEGFLTNRRESSGKWELVGITRIAT